MSSFTFLFSQEDQCAYDEDKNDYRKNITFYLSLIGIIISTFILGYVMYIRVIKSKLLKKRQSNINKIKKRSLTI